MKLLKYLRHHILLSLALLICSLHAQAQKNWEDIFTVYMLDPGGQFIQELDTQIQQMVPMSNLNLKSPRTPLMGHIELTFAGAITDDVDFYTISRPLQGNEQVDMDSSEMYQLVVFKKENIIANGKTKSQYHFSKAGRRWFTQPYSTSLYQDQKYQTLILSQGVLNMLQIDSTWPTVSNGNPHQFMEIIGGVARQADFIKLLKGQPNIIRFHEKSEDILIAIPLLELYDTNLKDYLFSQPYISLTEMLRHMALLARAMEFMHARSVAHGDIALKSLLVRFQPEMHIAFANFERSSKVDAVSGSHALGRKKFTFSNNLHHAPEIRFPAGYPKEWRYTSATLKGDIWSFGFMLAVVLNLYPQTVELVEKLQVNKPFYHYYTNQANGFIYNTEGLKLSLTASPLQQYFNNVELTQKDPTGLIPAIHEQGYKQLIELINSATQFDPERRPSASHIAETLESILKQLQ
ncbi:protein kinase domain-containing protein [Endozoicomonas lisbonensis]|uniref:Serine/threonine protein kinase n=1 Tax=Endozoicomonas lisbonensis TaxID=3120522 RepID=A0ABV2SLA2_9GAMM